MEKSELILATAYSTATLLPVSTASLPVARRCAYAARRRRRGRSGLSFLAAPLASLLPAHRPLKQRL